MKEWKISDGIPTFLAVALLILLEAGRLSGLVSDSQLGRCEIICNAAMLLFVVIGLFFQPLVSKEKPSLSIGRIAGIIGVSLISFPMNISVFGYKIRPEHWVSDLWGWHLFWIACAVLNLMLLSALGRFLLAQGKLLFTQFRGILRWAKQIVVILGSSFLDILDYIRKSEKNILLTIIIGIFLWIACFVVLVIREGRPAVFADMRFWGKTLLLLGLVPFCRASGQYISGIAAKSKEPHPAYTHETSIDYHNHCFSTACFSHRGTFFSKSDLHSARTADFTGRHHQAHL